MGSFGLAAALALTLASGNASEDAATAVRVAVLPLAFEGEEDAGAVNRLAERLGEGLGRGGVELVQRADVEKALDGRTCVDRPCAVALARKTSASFVVRATVSHHDRVYEL